MKKCKLCGGKAEIITSEGITISKYAKGYKVICSSIGCNNETDWEKTEAQAISEWQDSN
jgi:hypothetical protein